MKYGLVLETALAAFVAAAPVYARGVPHGSYLRSCTHVETDGYRLIASCRRIDGTWTRTALRGVHRCVGDIGNMNGQLVCNRRHAGL